MSTLTWSPSASDGRTVRVTWRTATLPYVVHWGDGDKTECGVGDGPVVHTYATSGTYDVVAVAERDYTAAARVTVRDWAKPPEPQVVAHGREVTLTLPEIADPVQWSISWGDGETTEHTTSTAVHTYGAPGEYEVTALDVPSKRSRTVVVQAMPPDRTWQHCGVWGYRRGSSPYYITGNFYGRDLPKSAKLWLRHTWSSSPDKFYGQASSDSLGWGSGFVDYNQSWHRPTAEGHSGYDFAYAIPAGQGADGCPPEVTRHSPVPMIVLDGALPSAAPTVLWWFDLNDPWTLYVGCQSPREGTYWFDWGDGSEPSKVWLNAGSGYCWTSHTYDRATSAATVTVSGPEGTATLPVAAPTTTAPYLLRNTAYGLRMGVHVDDPNGCDLSLPIAVDWGNNYPDDLPTWKHTLWPGDKRSPAYRWFPDRLRGETYVCTVYAPLSEPVQHVMRIPGQSAHASIPSNVVPPDDTDDQAPQRRTTNDLSAEFTVGTEWDGGYSGTITVHNHTGREVPAWQVEFALAEPGVAREVWSPSVHDARLAEAGAGRWCISSNTPIPASTGVAVNVRVEPPGKPEPHPTHLEATETTMPKTQP